MDLPALPACGCLRTKAFYLACCGEEDRVEFSPEAPCWCSQTLTVLGPDDNLCSPETCRPGRSCFRQ